jgi:cob(I)alamin adenosyltransferase
LERGEVVTPSGELEGNVIVLTGGGKGKTTAAVGLACRVLGHGGRATFIHFAGPLRPSLGEVRCMQELGRRVTMIAIRSQAAQESYLDQFDDSVSTVGVALERAGQLVADAECSLLVLDDINPLLDRGVIDQGVIEELIRGKEESVSIVFTGRSAPSWLLEMADIVTDFAEVKHPVHNGVGPRRGIEF